MKFVYHDIRTDKMTSSQQYDPQKAGEWDFIMFESSVSGGWCGDLAGGTAALPPNWTIE